MAKQNGDVDYFTLEVIQQALVALGDEMFTVLQRTAHSPLIFETLDFAVGATDSDGELICMGNGTTGFLGTLDASVREVMEKHGPTMERPSRQPTLKREPLSMRMTTSAVVAAFVFAVPAVAQTEGQAAEPQKDVEKLWRIEVSGIAG